MICFYCSGFSSRSQKDHSIFWRQHKGKKLLLVVYVDDIIVTGDDVLGIANLNATFRSIFRQGHLFGTFRH